MLTHGELTPTLTLMLSSGLSSAAARIVDKRLRLAWSSHRRHVVVDNSTDFNGKVNRVTQAVLKEAYKLGLVSTPPSMPSSPPAASAATPVVSPTS
jgi:hypothetical protein